MDARSDDFCSQLAKADAAYLWYGKEVFVGCGQKGRFWSRAVILQEVLTTTFTVDGGRNFPVYLWHGNA